MVQAAILNMLVKLFKNLRTKRIFYSTAEKENTMNSDKIEGNWAQLTGEIQKKWSKLTADNLAQIEGNRKKLAGAIQKSYDIALDEAERQMDEWEKARIKAIKSVTS
jgi:uncharacterized protein YjbJ (UPF0337 family)